MGVRGGTRAAARSVRSGAGRVTSLTRRATHAQGAGHSGLGSLIEAAGVNSAGDALVAVALAGTLFFGLDVHQARTQVALYLLVTMAPFALVAPLIGPALDRMRDTRRIAAAGTMLARALLCWGMAGAVANGDNLTLLPSAFGMLVLSKAFGILRSSITPRVLPEGITLVTANARASFAGLITAAIAAPIAAGLSLVIGGGGVLRLATPLFVVGAVLCLRLPPHIDTRDDEDQPAEPGKRQGHWRTLLRVGPVVAEAMQANAALRGFSGFLILYLAFLLRGKRFEPVSENTALGLLVTCAGAGGMVGTALGASVRTRTPQRIVFATLTLATSVAALGALFFSLWAALAAAFVGGFGQSLGKLSLDAVVQREIGEEVRSSTFAVSETLHQLVWVVGGLTGLGMSIIADGHAALGAVAGVLGLALLGLFTRHVRRQHHGHHHGRRHRRPPEGSKPPGHGGQPSAGSSAGGTPATAHATTGTASNHQESAGIRRAKSRGSGGKAAAAPPAT